MKRKSVRLSVCLAAVVVMGSGCSNKLLRETVLANTETMVGLSVAQNSQSQAYELKFGFARHELFIVPTDKFVKYAQKGGINAPETSSKPGADITANVVGEIRIGFDSDLNKQGAKVYQRLAVGPLAVQSPAAVALLADDAAMAETILYAQAEAATLALLDPVRVAARQSARQSFTSLTGLSEKKLFPFEDGDETVWVPLLDALDFWSMEIGDVVYVELWKRADPDELSALAELWESGLEAARDAEEE